MATILDPHFPALVVPEKDICALEAVLKDPAIGGFEEVKTLYNPSLETFLSKTGDLFADKIRDDLVLLYFSGHGALDKAGHNCISRSGPPPMTN